MNARITGFGLLLAVGLMFQFAIPFMRWAGTSNPYFTFSMALQEISGRYAGMLGLQFIIPAAFVIGCLGLGLVVASYLVPFVDRLFNLAWSRLTLGRSESGGTLAVRVDSDH